ncbi:MAG: hypothetical protein G3M78_08875 [Candidatus Nitrohelix vancouverensis]|uniref:DZANK-type domain-containing protein n=1 Tax=Candidatus Nitrohelix vancouverensis TaxID=2705534 RepID=A0A7T0C2S1_9BACT|nr:MAG: hypothetical protein G3M78_08875 [Candidatus Nitrohelix vancouverensis]
MSIDKCPQCGTANEDKASWCKNCLAIFTPYGSDKELRCPECFHPNSYTDDYCEVCHERLKPGQWE